MAGFEDRLEGIVNITMVGLALTLAREVGILEVLMEAEESLSPRQIAEKKDLKQRYVQEILDCLATAKIIQAEDMDEEVEIAYYLKKTEKDVLKKLTTTFRFPKAMIETYEHVRECIELQWQDGVTYPPMFHRCLEQYHIDHFYTYMEEFFYHGDDLHRKLATGAEVLEVACLQARFTALMAETYPNATITGIDNDATYRKKQTQYASLHPNLKLATFDLYSPDSVATQQYDWIYCINGLHDAPDPVIALKNVRKLLKPKGIFMIIQRTASGDAVADKGNLYVAGLYSLSTFFNVPESLYRDPKSQVIGLCWGRQRIIEMASAAGFFVRTSSRRNGFSVYTCRLGGFAV